MNEDVVQGRIGTVVEAEQTIKVLSNKVAEANEKLAKWALNFDVRLERQGEEYFLVIQAKTGERGARQTLTATQIEYLSIDAESFAKTLANQFVAEILGPVAEEALVPLFVQGVRNMSTLTKKSSL